MLFFASLIEIFICKTTSNQNKTSSLAKAQRCINVFQKRAKSIVITRHHHFAAGPYAENLKGGSSLT